MSLLKNPLVLALDVDTRDEAFRLLDQIGPLVGCVKLGPRLVYRYGSELVSDVSKVSPVFVDNKFFDIPSTMLAAVRASFEAGATLVTVHSLAGAKALSDLAKLEQELSRVRPFTILAVTVLTSWDQNSLPANMKPWSIEEHVKSLTEDISRSGLRGLVCSGHELQMLLPYKEIFKVVPGIRLVNKQSETVSEDQKRIMTPRQALEAGASAIVVGRPILQSNDPVKAVNEILESCKL